jgi:outer membrane autotransporter protein
MFQAAIYGAARFGPAYLSGALAYAWHQVSTSRYVTVLGTDNLTADFSAYNFGGRIETGYRFGFQGAPGWLGQYGITPYAALQMQSFHTPSYSELAVSGSSLFALNYEARTTRTTRTELGSRFDWSVPIDAKAVLTLRSRAAWAHDHWTDPTVNAMFPALPGANFTVIGAAPASDFLLASAGAEITFANGFSLAAWFDGGFAENAQTYAGTGRLRYTW